MKRYLIPSLIVVFLFLSCNHGKETSTEITDEQAIEILTIKISKDKKNHELFADRAKLLMKVGRVNDAISDLLQATQLKPNEVSYLIQLSDAYFANGDVEHSYSTLNQILDIDAANQEAILKQGEIAYYSRDYDRALNSLTKVTEKDPTNRTALTLKGFIYKEKGDTSNAIQLLRKVCDIYPDYSLAFEELGVIYASQRSPMAVEYFETAARLDPTNTNVLYNLAMYYQETEQIDAAEATYKQLLDIDDNNKHAWHNRGYIEMFYNNDFPMAIEYMTRALQCDSTFIEARVNRGWAYELDGDKEKARKDFADALNQDPDFQPAIEGMQRISKQ